MFPRSLTISARREEEAADERSEALDWRSDFKQQNEGGGEEEGGVLD